MYITSCPWNERQEQNTKHDTRPKKHHKTHDTTCNESPMEPAPEAKRERT